MTATPTAITDRDTFLTSLVFEKFSRSNEYVENWIWVSIKASTGPVGLSLQILPHYHRCRYFFFACFLFFLCVSVCVCVLCFLARCPITASAGVLVIVVSADARSKKVQSKLGANVIHRD